MIPIGTLCLTRIMTSGRNQRGDRIDPAKWSGRICTVIGHTTAHGKRTHDVRFEDGDGAFVRERVLIPIAPPGNPDRVDTPEREPVEVLR